MATATIGQLTLATSALDTDLIEFQVAASGLSRRITKANFIGATLTGGGSIATGGFTLTLPATGTAALKTGTPVTGRAASWNTANVLQDAGFDASDIARLSQAVTFLSTLRVGGASQFLHLQRAIVTINDTSFTTVATGLTGTALIFLQAVAANNGVSGMLFSVNSGGTLVFTQVANVALMSGAPTGFFLGYQASGTSLQIQAGASHPATLDLHVGIIQLAW